MIILPANERCRAIKIGSTAADIMFRGDVLIKKISNKNTQTFV
jgi:hypothetical protein